MISFLKSGSSWQDNSLVTLVVLGNLNFLDVELLTVRNLIRLRVSNFFILLCSLALLYFCNKWLWMIPLLSSQLPHIDNCTLKFWFLLSNLELVGPKLLSFLLFHSFIVLLFLCSCCRPNYLWKRKDQNPRTWDTYKSKKHL